MARQLAGSKDAKVKEDAIELVRTLEAVLQPRFEEKVKEGKKLREEGDLQSSLRLFEEALALLPAQPEVEFEVASLLAHVGKTGEAAAMLQQSIAHGFTRVSFLAEEAAVARLADESQVAELILDTFGAGALKKMKDRAANPIGGGKKGDRWEASIGLHMIYIEPQTFVMGSPASEVGRRSDEGQHEERIGKGYWCAETEVTQSQWTTVMGNSPWVGQVHVQTGAAVAATYINWNDANEFCRKLTSLERRLGKLPSGYIYRLPSESEWELACRAGSKTAYSFGQDAGQLGRFAVYEGCRAGEFASPVSRTRANAWGFYDMHGNVSEWCADTYRGGHERVFRGGCWVSSQQNCRSASRNGEKPDHRDYNLGFRPVIAASSDR
jgi:sulfatase modifying factor 1